MRLKGKSVFFLKLLAGIIFLGITDAFLGSVLKKIYFRQKSGNSLRITYSIDSTEAKVLVFGSSRASHHYVPEIFQQILDKDFYNTGKDGNGILTNYAIFKAITKRYAPQLVIIDIWPRDFFYWSEDYERLSVLLPYYRQHAEIQNIVQLKGKFEKYKMLSQIYPFNSQVASSLIGRYYKANDPGIKTNGYLPLFSTRHKIIPELDISGNEKIDSNKIKALNDIADICSKKHINLIFLYSPIIGSAASANMVTELKKINYKYQAVFWDFSNNAELTSHHELFNDNFHLNDKGARIFSGMVARRIVTSAIFTDQKQITQ